MKTNFLISKDFNRLIVHDSRVEKVFRDKEIVIIEFGSSFLKNYSENGISEGIVLGRTKMKVIGYKNEKFKLSYSGSPDFKDREPEYINYDQKLFEYWDVISENSANENNNSFRISGFYENNIVCWIDWTFDFQSIEISWENYIHEKDWLNGLVIEE